MGGYDPANPRRLCELPNCAAHRHAKKIIAVPLSFLQKNPPVDEELDSHKPHDVGAYDSVDPRQLHKPLNRTVRSHQKSIPAVLLSNPWKNPPVEEPNDDHRHKVGDYDPTSPRRLGDDLSELPESDNGVGKRKASDGLDSSDRPEVKRAAKEDPRRAESDEFSTPPSWYISKLTTGNRGHWALYIPPNKDYISHIFADDQEREDAIAAYGTEARLRHNDYLPHMFMYGIRYALEPGTDQTSGPESRTVLISGLDPKTTLSMVMSKVGGGKILKVNTTIIASEFMAFIQFVDCKGARSYMEHMKDKAVALFGHEGRVSLVDSHSYPISLKLEEQLQHGCTRHLAIRNVDRPHEFLKSFSQLYTHPEDILEDVWVDHRDFLFVLFRSVTEAVKFFGRIRRQRSMAELLKIEPSSVVFAQDPCDIQVHGLFWSHHLARGPYPSLLEEWTIQDSIPGSSHTDAPAEQSPVTQQPAAATELGSNILDANAVLKKSHSCSELKQHSFPSRGRSYSL